MNNIISWFIDESVLKEILIPIILFIGSIIFAINHDIAKKEYQKKYIIVTYVLYFIYFTFFGHDDHFINWSILPLIIIPIMLNLICGINLGYEANNLCKFLGRTRLVLYKTLEWFFVTKTYIVFCFLFTIKFINYLFIKTGHTHKYTYLIMTFIFFIYHLLTNMADTFGVYSFERLSSNLLRTRDHYKNKFTNHKKINEIINILGFIVYVEDKDFFDRRLSIFNPYYVIKRKVSNFKMKNIVPCWGSSWCAEEKIKVMFKFTRQSARLMVIILRNIESYIRGFSSIEQQIVRVSIMLPDTYEKYPIRRKIFVEWVVNPMFFTAFRKRRKRLRNIKTIDYDQYKTEILLFYYKKILKEPMTIDELIISLCKQSRLTTHSLDVLLNNYNNSILKARYWNILQTEFSKLRKVSLDVNSLGEVAITK